MLGAGVEVEGLRHVVVRLVIDVAAVSGVDLRAIASLIPGLEPALDEQRRHALFYERPSD